MNPESFTASSEWSTNGHIGVERKARPVPGGKVVLTEKLKNIRTSWPVLKAHDPITVLSDAGITETLAWQ